MSKEWIFTAENELDGEIALIETVDDVVSVVTNEPAQYRAALSEAGTIAKEAKNYMKEDEWNNTIRYVLLGEFDGKQDDVFYDGLSVKWRRNGEQLVLSIKRIVYTPDNTIGGSIGLGRVICSLASSGSSQKGLDSVLKMNHAFHKNVSSVWSRDLYRLQVEKSRLERQVEEIIDEKKRYEEEMMKRFAMVLNAKKDKIRELSGEGLSGAIKRELEDAVYVKQEPSETMIKEDPREEEGRFARRIPSEARNNGSGQSPAAGGRSEAETEPETEAETEPETD